MAARRNKFRAVETTVDGVQYASKFEAKVAAELEAHCDANGWTLEQQHAIKFACGAKYICDFVIRSAHGTIIWYVESKGKETPVWNLKLRMLRHEHPDIYDHLTVVYARNKGGKLVKKWGGWGQMSGPGRTPQTFDCGPAGMLTMRQMAKRIGIPTNTVKRRLYDGWKPVEVIAGERECEDKVMHRWRTAWLRPKVLAYASERMRTPIVNPEKLPLAYDPWCQAAIDVAEEDGGFTLDEIGVILGGISRERVRQIERAAFAKIRRYTGLKSKAEILAMLRALEADRVVNTNSFELIESLDYGECQLKQKRKEAEP